jgi:hypothetical protein
MTPTTQPAASISTPNSGARFRLWKRRIKTSWSPDGPAGKSTLLSYFRTQTKKQAVVLAPTGVAAVNIEGQTIHSFFHFKPSVTPASIKRKKKATRASRPFTTASARS